MKKVLILAFLGIIMANDSLKQDDELLAQIWQNFKTQTQNDALKTGLSEKQLQLSHLATILGAGGVQMWSEQLPISLKTLSGDEILEVLRQSTAYLGLARTREFFSVTAKIFAKNNVKTTKISFNNDENKRLKDGESLQTTLFGTPTTKSMQGDFKQIGIYLSQNCFGDYYTRTEILDLAQRELITFFYLASQGDTASQMKAHAKANFKQGNTKQMLIAAVNANIAFIGYPRSLNAISAILEASKE